MKPLLLAATVFGIFGQTAAARDWPMYRADAARSAYSPEDFAGPLSLSWSYQAAHAPQPAWPRSKRMLFDRAFEPVIADGDMRPLLGIREAVLDGLLRRRPGEAVVGHVSSPRCRSGAATHLRRHPARSGRSR